MKGFWAIYRRELFSLFITPLAWVILSAFLLIQGLHFFLIVNNYASSSEITSDSGPMQAFFGQTILLYLPLLFICPLLTMRLFAEEKKSGTIEALLTAPVHSTSVVLGKYLAALTMYVALWVPTLLYAILMNQASRVDFRILAVSYFAVVLVGAGYLSIGTLTSALSQNQLTAAVLSTLATVVLFMLGIGEFVFDKGPLHDICTHVSVWSQMNDFSKGIVDMRRIVFDLSVILTPLFLTDKIVDSWRWE